MSCNVRYRLKFAKTSRKDILCKKIKKIIENLITETL